MSQHPQKSLLDCSLRGLNRLLASSRIQHVSAVALVLAASIFGRPVLAQSQPVQFVKFEDFMAKTRTARVEDFMARPDSKIQDEAAFEEMRQAIFKRYEGVSVSHSFVLGRDHYDCMPIEQQPAVRSYGIKTIAVPPRLPSKPKKAGAESNASMPAGDAPAVRVRRLASLSPPDGVDAFGHAIHCQAGEIPLHRISLEALSRFATLHDYYGRSMISGLPGSKSDASGGPTAEVPALRLQSNATSPSTSTDPVNMQKHLYAKAYQYAELNFFHQTFTIWNPQVATSKGEVQSVEQGWLADITNTQTLENGLAVIPAFYGDSLTHWFIFSTPDNYQTRCIDERCTDFVLVSPALTPGQSIPADKISRQDSLLEQAEVFVTGFAWQLDEDGDWWLFNDSGDESPDQPIGYFPKTHFGKGDLPNKASLFAIGGEVASTPMADGTISFPPMGSGLRGTEFDVTDDTPAFITDIYYTDLADVVHTPRSPPMRRNDNKQCYDSLAQGPPGAEITLYFGGPGGANCLAPTGQAQ
jgi:neprosin-like protein